MDRQAWNSQKLRHARKYSPRYQQTIAAIKSGICRTHLSRIESAVSCMQDSPDVASAVVSCLNKLFHSIKFRWFFRERSQSGALLIRNETTGLLVRTSPQATSEAMAMVASDRRTSALVPEQALLALLEDEIAAARSAGFK